VLGEFGVLQAEVPIQFLQLKGLFYKWQHRHAIGGQLDYVEVPSLPHLRLVQVEWLEAVLLLAQDSPTIIHRIDRVQRIQTRVVLFLFLQWYEFCYLVWHRYLVLLYLEIFFLIIVVVILFGTILFVFFLAIAALIRATAPRLIRVRMLFARFDNPLKQFHTKLTLDLEYLLLLVEVVALNAFRARWLFTAPHMPCVVVKARAEVRLVVGAFVGFEARAHRRCQRRIGFLFGASAAVSAGVVVRAGRRRLQDVSCVALARFYVRDVAHDYHGTTAVACFPGSRAWWGRPLPRVQAYFLALDLWLSEKNTLARVETRLDE